MLKMSAVSAAFFDEGVAWVGAAITGRRTYDVSRRGSERPEARHPLFVVERRLGVGLGGGRTVPDGCCSQNRANPRGPPVAVSW
jgi:hypothetical protein